MPSGIRPWPWVARIAWHRLVLPADAVLALAAFRRVERDDVIALLDRLHLRPDLDHHAGALVTEDRREQALGIGAGQRELVGVADPGRLDLDQHLAGFRPLELHGLDRERLSGLVGNCRAYLHGRLPGISERREGVRLQGR